MSCEEVQLWPESFTHLKNCMNIVFIIIIFQHQFQFVDMNFFRHIKYWQRDVQSHLTFFNTKMNPSRVAWVMSALVIEGHAERCSSWYDSPQGRHPNPRKMPNTSNHLDDKSKLDGSLEWMILCREHASLGTLSFVLHILVKATEQSSPKHLAEC